MSSYQLPEDQGYLEVQSYEDQEDWDDDGHDFGILPTPRQSNLPLPSPGSGKSRGKHRSSKATVQSGSDTEKESSKMSSRSSKRSSLSSGSKKDKSSSKTKKSDDWSDVTEPDERRRIQNRIAQRKFRERAREQRDRAQRDAQNQQYAGSTYHIPDADEILGDDGDLSGLPWGGINMRHVVARGHASASSHSHHSGDSARYDSPTAGTTSHPNDLADHALYNMNPYGYAHPGAVGVPVGSVAGYDTTATSAGDGSSSVAYDSPYIGYYDYDPTGAGDAMGGHHQM